MLENINIRPSAQLQPFRRSLHPCHTIRASSSQSDNSHLSQIAADGTTNAATDRRTVLQVASAGALYSLAGRLITSTDRAAAAAPSTSSPSATIEGLRRSLDQRVSSFTLPNGMRFLVSERRAVPVVSFHTYADVGAFDEVDGATGLAHYLEHLAFKGTPRVGTRNFLQEAPLLDAIDECFYELRDMETSNSSKTTALVSKFENLQAQAASLAVPNAYGAMLQREGAVGLNAATTHDSTKYFCSLPSNKLELWFALESERFQAPVFREVYSEKKVVLEERRLRVDNTPLGAFQEEFARRSLTNAYSRPVIGFYNDIERLGRREVASFFAEHYGPSALTVSIVGDVAPEQVRRLAEKYFGGWNSAAKPGKACQPSSIESLPRPEGDRELSMRSPAGPAALRAYYRPCIRDYSASAALDVAADVLTGSRSSRLYRSLVLGGKALAVNAFASFPAEKHAALTAVYAIPSPGKTAQSVDQLVQEQIAQLVSGGPTAGELRKYSKAARMGVLELLQSNSGLASTLASYQVLTGDWRNVCDELERIEALTPNGVSEELEKYLNPTNSFVGYVQPV